MGRLPQPQHLNARGPIPVQLCALTWDSGLAGRSRRIAEAWSAAGVTQRFVEFPSPRRAFALRRRSAPADFVVEPPLPSRVPWWWLGEPALERRARKAAARLRQRLAREVELDHAVALVVTPFWTPWLDELPFRHVVYDCIDELAVHVRHPALTARFERWEEALLARASGAVVTAEVLGASIRARRPTLRQALVRNGVDDAWFQQRALESPRPSELPANGRKTVGFVGALFDWIDWELIEAVSAACPELDFVFVGPGERGAGAQRIARGANVRLLGRRAAEEVPAYVEAFDACWVPFKQDAVGLAANPVKTYEYLALGKPVVSTRVADMAHYEGLVVEAGSADAMVAAIRAALEAPEEQAAQRRAFAARNSWSARARELDAFFAALDEPAVAPTRSDRYRPRP